VYFHEQIPIIFMCVCVCVYNVIWKIFNFQGLVVPKKKKKSFLKPGSELSRFRKTMFCYPGPGNLYFCAVFSKPKFVFWIYSYIEYIPKLIQCYILYSSPIKTISSVLYSFNMMSTIVSCVYFNFSKST